MKKLQQKNECISDVFFRMLGFSNYCFDFHFPSGCKKSVSAKNMLKNLEITCYRMKKLLIIDRFFLLFIA